MIIRSEILSKKTALICFQEFLLLNDSLIEHNCLNLTSPSIEPRFNSFSNISWLEKAYLDTHQILVRCFDLGNAVTWQVCFGQNYLQVFVEDRRAVVLVETGHLHLKNKWFISLCSTWRHFHKTNFSIATVCWRNALWLVKNSHLTLNIQSVCCISE